MNPRNVPREFLDAALSEKSVDGLTHAFYKYPGRFSPLFARAAISLFSRPGDVVLDPFMGGGTTLVEASALGRKAAGVDINSLAVFVSNVKTSRLTRQDAEGLRLWLNSILPRINLRKLSRAERNPKMAGAAARLNSRDTWPSRKVIQLYLAEISRLPTVRQQAFARCILLRTAQWALDCRNELPSAAEFRKRLSLSTEEMIDGALEYSAAVKQTTAPSKREGNWRPMLIHGSIDDDSVLKRLKSLAPPSLVLTSPPYPGVHILYHRWQIHGRRETPVPFWIADSYDGKGSSFYTFGDRQTHDGGAYFSHLRSKFRAIVELASKQTIFVQLVGFSDPISQLPRYLNILKELGLEEVKLAHLANSRDGRIWRRVPNRKWYADQRAQEGVASEVVLLHRLGVGWLC